MGRLHAARAANLRIAFADSRHYYSLKTPIVLGIKKLSLYFVLTKGNCSKDVYIERSRWHARRRDADERPALYGVRRWWPP